MQSCLFTSVGQEPVLYCMYISEPVLRFFFTYVPTYVPISQYSHASLHRHMALVRQEPVLYSMHTREPVLYGIFLYLRIYPLQYVYVKTCVLTKESVLRYLYPCKCENLCSAVSIYI